jgi:deazaflavin-dependent oxidoreductase (nitroreductase family)
MHIYRTRPHGSDTPEGAVRGPEAKDHKTSFGQNRYRALVRPAVRLLARIHLRLLRASRGNLGHRLFGSNVVLLTTVGRRSGRQRTTPLAYLRHHDSLVVAASCGGSERVPEWWLNLQSQPIAVIERSGVKSVVRAYEAEREQLGHVTSAFEERFPQIHFYRAVSGRHIPLVVLEPHQRLRSDWPPSVGRRDDVAVG